MCFGDEDIEFTPDTTSDIITDCIGGMLGAWCCEYCCADDAPAPVHVQVRQFNLTLKVN